MADSSLARELMNLYDQVLELADHCAFICEAYSALALQNEAFDQHTAAGIALAGQNLRSRAEAVQEQVKEVSEIAKSSRCR